MINTNETLGQLATMHPAATHVFLRHRLDFCCGGGQKLSDACTKAGLDPNVIAHEIANEESAQTQERWDTKPLPEVIEFIIARYHDPLRRDLPVFIEAAKRVERVHGKKASCPLGLAACLEQMCLEIVQHLAKEEHVLFPAIAAGGGPHIQMPVRVMMQEHDDHGANLRRMRELTSDFVPPHDACATWRALYSGLEKLEAELMEHIHLENHVLFPRALGAR